MPEMKGGVFYEHGHRMIASAVGFLTILLAVWLQRSDDRNWMRRLGWIALVAVIAQGVLGGITVIYLLPPAVSISHACLAQLFFCTTVAVAMFTSPAWRETPAIAEDYGWPSMRFLAAITPVLVLAQIALGAGYRHRAFGIMPHVIGAMIVGLILLMVGVFVLVQFSSIRPLRLSATTLVVITVLQILLGVGAYLARISTLDAAYPMPVMVVSTVAHVAMGALTMACSVALALLVFRHLLPRTVQASDVRMPAVSR
jgi:heme a synthase